MARNLILTGGIGHPFEDAAPALAGVLAKAGIESDITFDIEDGIARLAEYDLLTVYALRWRMLDAKYTPHRDQWAFSLSEQGRAGIAAHLAEGRGLLALHTAAICFDDWPEWGHMLGGHWVWGRSHHPPRGALTTAITDTASPLTQGLAGFDLADDEVYSDLEMRPGVVPLMTARAATYGDDWPMLWTHDYGPGRVAVDLLGHDRAALEHPVHRRILSRCARWCLGRPDAEVAGA
jgi:type 1 glutamine amidotransferase